MHNTVAEYIRSLLPSQATSLANAVAAGQPYPREDPCGYLVQIVMKQKQLEELYDQLSPIAQAAVREATYRDDRINSYWFQARYGKALDPDFCMPRLVNLFIARLASEWWLHPDLRDRLRRFVLPPEPFAVEGLPELPDVIPARHQLWMPSPATVLRADIRSRDTSAEAEAEINPILALARQRRLGKASKGGGPRAAMLRGITGILRGGDYYTPADADANPKDPAGELAIKPLAWLALLRAAVLLGDDLRPTKSGLEQLDRPAGDILRTIWQRLKEARDLDEFREVSVFEGQRPEVLTCSAARRAIVVDALARTPKGLWLSVDDFLRMVRLGESRLELQLVPKTLYVAPSQCPEGNAERKAKGGSMWHRWEQGWWLMEARYILACLFGFLAPLGLIDVAYVRPQGARGDARWCPGAGSSSCLSRFDGLLYLRVNALGAGCLSHDEPARRAARAG